MALPTITVNFYEAAKDFVARTANGKMAILLKVNEDRGISETTTESSGVHVFYSRAEVEESTAFNAVHKRMILSAFYDEDGLPEQVIVAIHTSAILALNSIINKYQFAWVAYGTSTGDASRVTEKIFEYNENTINANKIKLMMPYQLYVQATMEDDHVCSFNSNGFTLDDGTVITSATNYQYVPRICGIACGTPITGAVTFKQLADVKGITYINPSSPSIVPVNYQGVIRLSTGIVSTGEALANIEARDIICEDIQLAYRTNYLGKKRNTKLNQVSFCSAVLGYFKDLQAEGVINPDEDISCEQDVDAMRLAHPEYYYEKEDEWVKAHPYGSEVYIKCSAQIMGVMDKLTFNVYLQ